MGWRVDLRRSEPRFIALLLKSRTLADLADVSSVPQINNKHINPIGFPAPPLKEQTSILERLDEELNGLMKAQKAAETEIGLLREYRIRLIADVVTGKLDALEAAAKLPMSPKTMSPKTWRCWTQQGSWKAPRTPAVIPPRMTKPKRRRHENRHQREGPRKPHRRRHDGGGLDSWCRRTLQPRIRRRPPTTARFCASDAGAARCGV